jgi:hypothetical protein
LSALYSNHATFKPSRVASSASPDADASIDRIKQLADITGVRWLIVVSAALTNAVQYSVP